MDQVCVPSAAPVLCALHLNAVDKIPPVFSIRWSNDSSSRRNFNPVFQICRIHRGLHSELDRPVCGGDGLPHPGGEHVAIPPKDVSSWIIINRCVKITHTDSDLFFFDPPEVPAELLFPHLSVLLCRLRSVCEVQRPGDQESDDAGDRRRVREDAQQK